MTRTSSERAPNPAANDHISLLHRPRFSSRSIEASVYYDRATPSGVHVTVRPCTVAADGVIQYQLGVRTDILARPMSALEPDDVEVTVRRIAETISPAMPDICRLYESDHAQFVARVYDLLGPAAVRPPAVDTETYAAPEPDAGRTRAKDRPEKAVVKKVVAKKTNKKTKRSR